MSEDNGSERPVRILLQTTIPSVEDDWNIERFSLLREHLASLTDDGGNPRYEVVARDREADAVVFLPQGKLLIVDCKA